MDGWNRWEGKRVFLITRSGRNYTGNVISVDDLSPPLIFLTLKDKFDQIVTFSTFEILEIKEETK